ncbi:MAG: cation:dicarboxylate symporter family transporter [Clostridium sp.]
MDSTFFSKFIMITNIKTVLFLILFIAILFAVNKMEKKIVNFSTRLIISTTIGLLLGAIIQMVAGFPSKPSEVQWLSEVSKWYSLIGNGFMDLLKMIIVPLVFISIIRVIINMKSEESLRKITFRSLAMLLGTTAIAAVIGVVIGNLFKLGVSANIIQATTEIKEVTSIVDTVRGLLPSNPVKAMSESNIVAVVIFAAFIGLAIKSTSKIYPDIIKPLIDLIEASYKVITSISLTIIRLMPYAIVALLANTIIGRGLESLYTVLDFIVALYVSLLIMFAVHLLIISLNGLNPITYIKNVSQPLILAFTSRSSLGTLPVTIETLTDKVGLKNGLASFVGSLGSNAGMNGCAGIYPALVAVTIANMSGTKMDFTFYAMLIFIVAISSLGIAGLPGTATMAVSVVISGMGMGEYFPLVGAILAIDPILDMGRTMLNVNGTMVAAITVGNSFSEVDKEVFNSTS